MAYLKHSFGTFHALYSFLHTYKDKQSFTYKYQGLTPLNISSLAPQSVITYHKHCLASILNSIVSSVLSHWVLPHYAVVSAPFEKLRSRNGPPKFGGDQLACFQETRVAGRFMIVAALENGTAKGVISGDVVMAFVDKDARFNLPVGKSRTEGERNVRMHRLESLKDKGVTRGCRFNAM